ncbi:hypothetical protein LCGC14_1560610 [marine sediment metagenome]|uniref:Uncharacterized protein n=1 Tax=marine sediment metagenome TaxID=412755 RepID=A0A0F9J8M2_9ZZZZ
MPLKDRGVLGAPLEPVIIGAIDEGVVFVPGLPTVVSDNPPRTFEVTSFVSVDSPANLSCHGALGRNATQFSIQNDGPGDFTVAISIDGIAFGDEKTVKSAEVYTIDGLSVDTIKITHVADSAYRVVVL